jgi:hypothetical protein
MEETELIERIKMALSPKVRNWVLFSNGTVVVIDDMTKEENLKEKAIKHMKELGPVYPGSEAGDFGTIRLVNIDGWMVYGYGYGMYTYVHPHELKNSNPNDIEIGIYGRCKRHKDSEELYIIYINANLP